jgi:flagellar secretion chaperone FliS
MFGTASPRFGAAARYTDVDLAARVQGASPHGLVSILFEELEKGLDTLAAAERLGSATAPQAVQARAIGILHSLEESLDVERGGEVAENLGRIYREVRRLICISGEGRGAALKEARAMIGEIAGAWKAIG